MLFSVVLTLGLPALAWGMFAWLRAHPIDSFTPPDAGIPDAQNGDSREEPKAFSEAFPRSRFSAEARRNVRFYRVVRGSVDRRPGIPGASTNERARFRGQDRLISPRRTLAGEDKGRIRRSPGAANPTRTGCGGSRPKPSKSTPTYPAPFNSGNIEWHVLMALLAAMPCPLPVLSLAREMGKNPESLRNALDHLHRIGAIQSKSLASGAGELVLTAAGFRLATLLTHRALDDSN